MQKCKEGREREYSGTSAWCKKEGENERGRCFASHSTIICPLKKERRKKKGGCHTHRATVWFLWKPKGYYRTLPFIIKGLSLMERVA